MFVINTMLTPREAANVLKFSSKCNVSLDSYEDMGRWVKARLTGHESDVRTLLKISKSFKQ